VAWCGLIGRLALSDLLELAVCLFIAAMPVGAILAKQDQG
jgi:hypothetical protein